MGGMMDYEPITNELREYIRDNTPRKGNCWWQPEDTKAVIACCDSIDAIQRSLEAENERLRNALARGDDWIKLPADADGVTIRIDDALAEGEASPQRVKALMFDFDGWSVSFGIGWCGMKYYKWHHVKPETWESIISDAVKLGFTDPDNEHLADKLVARCKALCERTREGE